MPTYVNAPPEKYIVISNPWGMRSAGQRREDDFKRLGAWLRCMLRRQPGGFIAEVVYHKRTEEPVVVQLPADVDIEPLLGAHPWSSFWSTDAGSRSNKASYIFEYNWRNNGDPGNKDWDFAIPNSDIPPPSFPVKDPYPDPFWAERPYDIFFRSLTLALPPREAPPTPPPLPTPTKGRQVKMEGSSVKTEEKSIKMEVPLVKTEQESVKTEEGSIKTEAPLVKTEQESVKMEEPFRAQMQPDKAGELSKHRFDKSDRFKLGEATKRSLHNPSSSFMNDGSSPFQVKSEATEVLGVKAEPKDHCPIVQVSREVEDAFTQLQARNLLVPSTDRSVSSSAVLETPPILNVSSSKSSHSRSWASTNEPSKRHIPDSERSPLGSHRFEKRKRL